VDIFTEPTKAEWKIANEVLKEAGISMTAMSASNMRHVVNGMKAYAEELQAVLQESVPTTNSAQISRKLVDTPT
jgi:alkylation response protein AidB-like acyl-CoA dehydrogenase